MVCTLLAGVNVVAFAADGELTDTVSVQKFYYDTTKGGNGEHIYTIDEDEISWYKSLPSWNDEGEAWKAPLMSEVPVYRVANYSTGEHLWITDKGYVDYLVALGWTQEQGIAFYSDENMGVPVYRLWDGTDRVGSHHFSTNEEEIAWLVSTGWTNEGPQFYGVKEEEPGEKEMTAVQTGSKEITVVSETEFTGAEEFTVMKGAVEQSVAAVDFDDDMCTVTLSMDGNISETEYTVICSDTEYEPASFTGEVGKLAGIYISENLIFMGQTGANEYSYAVGYKTLDQWMNDFTVTSFDSAICSADPTGANTSYKDGMLTVKTAQPLTIGTQQTVSLVKGTVVGTQTVTVSATSAVADMTVGELTATPTEALINTTGRVDVADISQGDRYFFPVSATDQYGNKLNAKLLNSMVTAGTLVVSPDSATAGGVIRATGEKKAAPTISDVFTELEDGTVVMFVKGDRTSYGNGIINLVSTAGEVETATATIAQNERIEDITFVTASSTLQSGKPVGAAVIATNNFGEPINMYEDVEIDDTSKGAHGTGYYDMVFAYTDENGRSTDKTSHIALTNAVIDYVDDAATETRAFGVVGGLSTQSATLTVYSANGTKVSPFVYTVDKAATVAGIKGFTAKAAKNTTFATTGQTITVSKDSFVWLDSDGESYKTAPDVNFEFNTDGAAPTTTVKNKYYAVASVDGNKLTWKNISTTAGTADLQPGAATQPGTYKMKVDLYSTDASNKLTSLGSKTFEYKLFNADDKNMTYTATLMTDAPTGNLPMAKSQLYIAQDDSKAAGTQSPEKAFILVTATDSNGATIIVNGSNIIDGITVTGGDIKATTGGAVSVDYNAEDKAGVATAHVWIGGKDVTQVAIPYDVEAPEAMVAMFMNAADDSIYLESSFTKVAGITKQGGLVKITDEDNNLYMGAVLDQYSHIMGVDAVVAAQSPVWSINGKEYASATTILAGKKATLAVSKDGVSGTWTLVTGTNPVTPQ